MDLCIYEVDPQSSPQEQMATDLWILRETDLTSSYGFRVYKMKDTCTLGRSQKLNSIKKNNVTSKIILNRPTAGGAVIHGKDVTFTLTIPPKSELYMLSLSQVYLRVHSIMKMVLKHFLIDSKIYGDCSNHSSSFCFEFPAKYDLIDIDTNKKVLGSAIKKSKEGILLQGNVSFQLPLNDFEYFFIKEFSKVFTSKSIFISKNKYRKCCHWQNFCQQFSLKD